MNTKTIVLFALLAVLAACAPLPAQPAAPNATTNTTPEIIDHSVIAEKGDLISINYTITLENGTVADTNNPELARKNGVKSYVEGPFRFILGQSGKVPGFDEHIEGLKLNTHRETIIPPSEPEIVIPVNRTITRDRFLSIPLYQEFPRKTFEMIFGVTPVLGQGVFNKTLEFHYQIVNMTNESVTGKIITKKGDKYQLQNTEWPSQVVQVRENDFIVAQMPNENLSVHSDFGPAGVRVNGSKIVITLNPELGGIYNKTITTKTGFSIPSQFQVIELTNTTFTIKRYGALTDKKLLLSVDLLDLTKNVKQVKDKKLNAVQATNSDVGN